MTPTQPYTTSDLRRAAETAPDRRLYATLLELTDRLDRLRDATVDAQADRLAATEARIVALEAAVNQSYRHVTVGPTIATPAPAAECLCHWHLIDPCEGHATEHTGIYHVHDGDHCPVHSPAPAYQWLSRPQCQECASCITLECPRCSDSYCYEHQAAHAAVCWARP